MGRFLLIRGTLIFIWCGWFFVLVAALQGVTGKTTTTEDTLTYENDPGTQVTLRPPGPSIFEYAFSSSPSETDSKVKRANAVPRYYEMVEDEVYVFEPSELGMSPFMEAMNSDYNAHQSLSQRLKERKQNRQKAPQLIEHSPPQTYQYEEQQQGPQYDDNPHPSYHNPHHHVEGHRDNQNYQPNHNSQFNFDEHSSIRHTHNQYNHNQPPPRPSLPEGHNSHNNNNVPNANVNYQTDTATGRPATQSQIPQNPGRDDPPPLFQREHIPVIEEIPILIPHSTSSQQVIPPQLESPPQQSTPLTRRPFFSSPPPLQRFPDNSDHSEPSPPVHSNGNPSSLTTPSAFHQPHENSVVPRHGPQCTTSNDKDGQCISFRRCYPVVFNSVDGELRDPGLAKILFQAAGSCDPTYESNHHPQNKEKVIPGIIDNDPNIPPDFFNHSICCATFYLSNNNRFDHGSSEPKTMRPSPPDPRKSPPEFQEEHTTQQSYQQQAGGLEPEFDIEDSSSDYFGDEYTEDEGEEDDDYLYTSTEIPKLVPKKVKGKNSTESAEEKKTDAATKETNKEISTPPKTQDKSESIQKEVKVDGSTGKSKSTIKVIKKKVKKIKRPEESKVEREVKEEMGKVQKGEISNDSPSRVPPTTLNPSKPGGHVPYVMEAPELLSAWECPGRKIGMPRGHWPWMVALLNEGNHFCSGSLIDHKHILTSSSCVAPFLGKDIGKLRVILGDRVLYSSVDGPHLWRGVVRIARHLQFDPVTMQNDIAIIEMDHAVGYTRTVQPINLPSSSNHSHVTRGIVSGWSGADIGKRRFFAPRSTIDSVAEFIGPQECSQDYNGFLGHPDISTRNLICTKPTKASCMADPGGPLMIKTNTCWHIIGILSHGLRCGSFPDLFTDTAKFLPWIHKNIRQKPLA